MSFEGSRIVGRTDLVHRMIDLHVSVVLTHVLGLTAGKFQNRALPNNLSLGHVMIVA